MKQSILKSILNQHNISQSSSRYFKIIERCSNGFLHIRFLIAFKRFDPGLKCNVAQRKNLFDGSSVYYRTRHTHTQKKIPRILPKWQNQISKSILLDA